MRRVCVVLSVVTLLVSVTPALDLQLTITNKTTLKGDLEDLVVFGGIKEMTCDSNGNIFSPSTRKYSSADSAIVRFPHDASSFSKFSIDSLDSLKDGTITDFELEPNGELFVLARQVLKYSNLEVPIEFGKNFILHYDHSGKVLSQIDLKLDTNNFSPTGFAVLQGGEFLVVGYRLEKGNTFLIAESFLSTGTLKARVNLNPNGTKTSKGKTVASPRVFHPTAIKAQGLIYVLRGTTTEPIYVLSESGQLMKSIQLSPADLEFDSPKILGNGLIVREHPPSPSPDPSTGIIELTHPTRINLPIFSMETGKVTDRYFWYNETAGLACATSTSLTFIGQDISAVIPDWAVFETKPAGSRKSGSSAAGR
jgi:hypothetical protein